MGKLKLCSSVRCNKYRSVHVRTSGRGLICPHVKNETQEFQMQHVDRNSIRGNIDDSKDKAEHPFETDTFCDMSLSLILSHSIR